jgi:phosphotransferase system enzyme I (PtsI)
LHPAVLQLLFMTISAGAKAGIPVAVCGEIAGDTKLTRLLLGMGLREFSMHPAQLLSVKHEILNSDLSQLEPAAKKVLKVYEPAAIADAMEKLSRI